MTQEKSNHGVDSLMNSISTQPTPAPGPFNMGAVSTSFNVSMGSSRSNDQLDRDTIHEQPLPSDISPAQLYLTESGHLFHAGKICIVLVGLPARGKTHHAVALTRYLRWLGVRTHAFHLGDYRRREQKVKPLPEDYFEVDHSKETHDLRQKVFENCISDLEQFLTGPSAGQVAIYDAVNPTSQIRRSLKERFEKLNIGVLFVECIYTNDELVARNVRDVKLTSPDFKGIDEVVRIYLRRIQQRIPFYETMCEPELSYIKLINVSERFVLNRAPLGYLQNKIVYFLMNTHLKTGCVYFARAGFSEKNAEFHYRNDEPLSESGHEYAARLRDSLFSHLAKRNNGGLSSTIDSLPPSDEEDSSEGIVPDRTPLTSRFNEKPPGMDQYTTPTPTTSKVWERRANQPEKPLPLTVWSSKRIRTLQTASYLSNGSNVQIMQRTLLIQMNPGIMDGLEDSEISEKYPEEYKEHSKNPYHHRYTRAESYHDLAVRMEPLIMEIERTKGDLVIIAHESVLRVLYGYLMACKVGDIPFLRFPKDEIIEVKPNAYYNIANRIKIGGEEP